MSVIQKKNTFSKLILMKQEFMKEYPLITIGITCYNAADTISRAIESAIKQDWPNFEIIAVDDCSTDDSLDYIAKFLEITNMKIIRHEVNQGYPSALNTILSNSNGEFIAFFDDDDQSAPTRLTQQFKHITKYEDNYKVDKVICYSRREIKKGQEKFLSTLPIGYEGLGPYGDSIANFILLQQKISGYSWGEFGSCTMMARTKTFKEVGLFDPSFRRCAEWDFAIRAGFKGASFSSVADPLITQYITAGMDKSGNASLRYMLKLREKYKPYLISRRGYLSSICLAYVRFYWGKNKLKYYFYLFLAILCYPKDQLNNYLFNKS